MEQKLTEAEHSRSQMRRFCTKFCTPVFLEAFVLTFLAGRYCAEHAQQPAGCDLVPSSHNLGQHLIPAHTTSLQKLALLQGHTYRCPAHVAPCRRLNMGICTCRVGRSFTDCHCLAGSCVQPGWSDHWRGHRTHALHRDSGCRGPVAGDAHLTADCCSGGRGAIPYVRSSQCAQQSFVRAREYLQKASHLCGGANLFRISFANADKQYICKGTYMRLSSR